MSEATPMSVADVHASLIAQHATVTEELRETKETLAHLMERRKKLHAEERELTRAIAFYQRMRNPRKRARITE